MPSGRSLLAVLTLAICSMALSIPQQIPFRTPPTSDKGAYRVSASSLIQGKDLKAILGDMANDLDQGIPAGWERLLHAPDSRGNSGIELINPQDIKQVIEPWAIDGRIHGEVVRDITALIQISAGEGYYVAQHFTYSVPQCHAGARPVCLTTLFAVVRPRNVDQGRVLSTELAHIYIQSGAETFQQLRYYETCHRCWLRRCCHQKSEPRGLTPQEINDIQRVLSTSQAQWARMNLPASKEQQQQTLELDDGSVQVVHEFKTWPMSDIDKILRRFIENTDENKDVFKKQNESLIVALQNDTRSRRQNVKSMTVSATEQDVVILLNNMMSDCLQKAGLEESVADWFKRVYPDKDNKPISLECEVSGQRRVAVNPPAKGCVSSTSITSKAMYSWVILSPRNNLVDCLFLSSDVVVNYVECIPQPSLPDDPSDKYYSYRLFDDTPIEESKGSVVRWAILQPDGSFNPISYLVQWNKYPMSINKALLDILRLASAVSYLKVNIPSIHAVIALQDEPTSTNFELQMVDPATASFGASMMAFAQGWSAVAKALRTTIKEEIKLKVCLGFDEYRHTTKAMRLAGVDKVDLLEVVEHIIKVAQLPDDSDLKSIMLGVKYSEKEFTWTGESMLYTAPDGRNHFLYLTKHADPQTNMTGMIYGMVSSNYKLAPDMLIVNRKTSVLGGIFGSEKTTIRKIPHVLSLNDTVILEMYFEMVVFRQMAIVSNLTPPAYPDLSSLCDRSTN
ncbi:hypothetical protein BGX26_010753 [Mortierella sp. AD094]|nr:hypothetical protein BGX26_010753 [Mortierella sp. AD094]